MEFRKYERIEKTCNTDIVFVDDNESYLLASDRYYLIDTISKGQELSVNTYTKSDDFINKYSKDTKIVVEHDMKHKMNGFDLAHKLHESGRTRFWMR